MAQGVVDRAHPTLKALRIEADELAAREAALTGQMAFMARELGKQRRGVVSYERTLTRLEEAYKGMKNAKVASLKEAQQLRLLIATNRDLLEKTNDKVKQIQATSKRITEQLSQIGRSLKQVNKELSEWNKLVSLDRKK